MKKMKKLIALALATTSVVSAFAMASCGGSGGGTGGEKVDTSRTQIYVNNYSGGYGVEWLTEIKKAYEKAQEGVCWEAGTEKKGVQIIINNTRPELAADSILGNNDEVYFTENVHYQALLADNVFADITSVITATNPYDDEKTIVSKFKQQQADALNVGGKYYAIPHYEGAYGLIYNKELFDSKGYYLIQNIADDTNVDEITLSDYFDVRKTGENYTAGPDGIAGNDDDGLPATYTEFFALCEWISRRNDTPLLWTGKYRVLHLKSLLGTLLADYEGLDSMLASINFDGTQVDSLGKIVNGKFTLDGESVEINESNGYDISRRAGVYYALKFLKNVFGNEKYYNEKAFSDGYSHTDAQNDFLLGYKKKTGYPAMLVEGVWWENEARGMFNSIAQEKPERGYGKQDYRYMLLPAIEGQKGIDGKGNAVHGNTGLGTEIGHIVFGMDTGVGAAAANHLDLLAAHHGKTALQRLGHGDLRFLYLPAVVGRAVVHQNQGNVSHLAHHLSVKSNTSLAPLCKGSCQRS